MGFLSARTTAITKNAATAAMIMRPPSASNQRCFELGSSIYIATTRLIACAPQGLTGVTRILLREVERFVAREHGDGSDCTPTSGVVV